METLTRLWQGEVPLARAFWVYAAAYGSFANLVTTILALGVIAADWPVALAVAVHFATLPYNVLAVIGVWRSAARYRGDPVWAGAARIGAIVWGIAATLL